MSHVVIDDDLKAKLNGLNETVEFRDATGKPVGQFVPQDEYMKLLYAWAKTEVTDEELDRVSREGGSTLAEIFKRRGMA